MTLTIKKAQAEAIGMKALMAFLGDQDAWGYASARSINLGRLTNGQLDKLEDLIAGGKKFTGRDVLLKDLATWRAIQAGQDGDLKPRTLRIFEAMLTRALAKTPRQWIFIQKGGQWLPYWVQDVEFHPEQDRRGDRTPPYVSVTLFHRELGISGKQSVSFRTDDIRGTVQQILVNRGWVLATDTLIAMHQAAKYATREARLAAVRQKHLERQLAKMARDVATVRTVHTGANKVSRKTKRD